MMAAGFGLKLTIPDVSNRDFHFIHKDANGGKKCHLSGIPASLLCAAESIDFSCSPSGRSEPAPLGVKDAVRLALRENPAMSGAEARYRRQKAGWRKRGAGNCRR